MKFSDMTYSRPDPDRVKREYRALTDRFRAAKTFEEARQAFLERDILERNIVTQYELCYIRNSIDTRDGFYETEKQFWNKVQPELQEYRSAFSKALLETPFRTELTDAYGDVMFLLAEAEDKAFSPDIIADMQAENDLKQRYNKLVASAKIPFEGGVYNTSQMALFLTAGEDDRRLAAWTAEGQWFRKNQEAFDDIYDKLVHLRDNMAKKLGYPDYRTLGYYRMRRISYTREDVERFRKAVAEYLVPVAESVFKKQAERLGKDYPMSYADNALKFRSGNPRPKGGRNVLVDAGKRFYDALSPETSEFFRRMIDDDLMDLDAKEGKQAGGYMTEIPDYGVPFIFANFNGTQHDVEVITHEAGHAFAGYLNMDRVPTETVLPTMEGAEVHSMSMEFFAWRNLEDFFGEDAKKYRYTHLAGAVVFIPYGTLVDHFQHSVYENPDMTPQERHEEWKRLQGIYTPWIRLDGEIPFYAEGHAWQKQQHIYNSPFYYIDYCLAQTVALSFWSQIQDDPEAAWKRYMAYSEQGGSKPSTRLLQDAGLDSPFDESMLRTVCERAKEYLDRYDLTGIA